MRVTEQTIELYRDLCVQRYEETSRGIGRVNIAIFGADAAGTGIGRPLTNDRRLYLHVSGRLDVVDTRGVEVGSDTDKVISDLEQYVVRMRSSALSEQVRVAWYCFRATRTWLEGYEAKFIRALQKTRHPGAGKRAPRAGLSCIGTGRPGG